jgi:hypothetical protein
VGCEAQGENRLILKAAFTKTLQATDVFASGLNPGALSVTGSINREASMRALFLAAIAAATVTVTVSFESTDAEAAACVRGARGVACAAPRAAVVAPRARVGVVAPRARVGVVAPRRGFVVR